MAAGLYRENGPYLELEEPAAGGAGAIAFLAGPIKSLYGKIKGTASELYKTIEAASESGEPIYSNVISAIFNNTIRINDTGDTADTAVEYVPVPAAPAVFELRRSPRLAAAQAAEPSHLSGIKRRTREANTPVAAENTPVAAVKTTKKARNLTGVAKAPSPSAKAPSPPAKAPSPPILIAPSDLKTPYRNLHTRLSANIPAADVDKFINFLIILDSLHDFAKPRSGYSYHVEMRKHIANSYVSKYLGKPYSAATNETTMINDLLRKNIKLSSLEENVVNYLTNTLPSLLNPPIGIELTTIDGHFDKINRTIYDKPSVKISVGDKKNSANLHLFIDKFLMGNIISPTIYVTIDGYPNSIITTTLEKYVTDSRTYYQAITPQNVLDSSTTSTTHFGSAARMNYVRKDQILTRSDITVGTFNYDININDTYNPPYGGLYNWFYVNVTKKADGLTVGKLLLDAVHLNGTSVRSIGEYIRALDGAGPGATNAQIKAAIADVEAAADMKSLLLGTILEKTARPAEFIDTALDQKYGGDSGQYNAAYWLNMKGIPTIFATADTYAAHMAVLQGVPTILGLPSSILLIKGSNYTPDETEQYKNSIFRSIAKLNTIFNQLNFIIKLDISGSPLNSLLQNILVNLPTWTFSKTRWPAVKEWHEALIKLRAIDIAFYLVEKHRELKGLIGGIKKQLAAFLAPVGEIGERSGININISNSKLNSLNKDSLKGLADHFSGIVGALNSVIAGSDIIDVTLTKYSPTGNFIFGDKHIAFFVAGSTVKKIPTFAYDIDLFTQSASVSPVEKWLGDRGPLELCEVVLDRYIDTIISRELVAEIGGEVKRAFASKDLAGLGAFTDAIIGRVIQMLGGTVGGGLLVAPGAQPMATTVVKGQPSYKPRKLVPDAPTKYAKDVLAALETIIDGFKNVADMLEFYPMPEPVDEIYVPDYAATQFDAVIRTVKQIFEQAYTVSQESNETLLHSAYIDIKEKWQDLVGELTSQAESADRLAICAPLTDYFAQHAKMSQPLLDALAYIYYIALVDKRVYRLYNDNLNLYDMALTWDTAPVTESNVGSYIATVAKLAANEAEVARVAGILSFHTGLPTPPFIPADVPAFFDPLTGAELSSARSALLASQPLTGEATEEGRAIIAEAEAEAKASPAKEETKEEGLTSEITKFLGNLGLKGGAKKSRHRKTAATRRKQKRRVTRKKWPGNKCASRRRA